MLSMMSSPVAVAVPYHTGYWQEAIKILGILDVWLVEN
jgi:hypothetical protein